VDLDPWIKIPVGGRNHANKILQKKLSQMTNKTQQTNFGNDDAKRTKKTNKFCKHALMTIEEQCMMIGLPKANL